MNRARSGIIYVSVKRPMLALNKKRSEIGLNFSFQMKRKVGKISMLRLHAKVMWQKYLCYQLMLKKEH